MKTFLYLLSDNGGVSNSEDQELLIPKGTVFLHEFGLYKVVRFYNDEGDIATSHDEISQVLCERIYSLKELNKNPEILKLWI